MVICTDINECTNGSHSCDANFGICHNFDGGHNCSCPDGFEDENGDGSGLGPQIRLIAPSTKLDKRLLLN